jgi:hypothetical protein
LQRWKLGDRLIDFAGCEHEDDKHRFKGDPPIGTAANSSLTRRPRLHEPQIERRLLSAHEARLRRYELQMRAVAIAARFAEGMIGITVAACLAFVSIRGSPTTFNLRPGDVRLLD